MCKILFFHSYVHIALQEYCCCVKQERCCEGEERRSLAIGNTVIKVPTFHGKHCNSQLIIVLINLIRKETVGTEASDNFGYNCENVSIGDYLREEC